MSDRNYGAIRESESAIKLIERIESSGKPFAFDIEAGYVGPDKEGVALMQFHPDYIVVGISLTVSTEWARYIPIAHDDGGNVDDLPAVVRALWRLLNTGRGIAHNAAYELKGMARLFREVLWNDPEYGEAVRASYGHFPILSDTMLEVWLAAEYDPLRIGKDLKSVALEAFGLEMTKYGDLFPPEDSDLGPGTKRGKTRFTRFNTRNSRHPKVINYACEDSVAALLVFEKHNPAQKDQFIYKIEMQLLPVLCEMEMGEVDENGVAQGNMLIDWAYISKKAEEVARFRDKMNEEILQTLSERLGRVINANLGSVPQLQKLLFDPEPEGLGLPVKLRSEKTNAPSTSDDALKVIAKSDPVIKKILEWRQVVKLYGSYLHKYETELNYHPSGRAFPNHNQAGALTGRMSVDQVSYQQWPKPYHYELLDGTTFDLSFRDLFIAPEDYRIVGFDYSQVELRVLAAMANERPLLEAFANNTDIHKATASTMMGVPLEEVTKKQRSQGKTLNFAIVYGAGPSNIAEQLSAAGEYVSKDDAQELLDRYFAAFPGLKNWMDQRVAEGREQKYVETFFKRKFTVWEYFDHRDWIRSKGDRMCVNAPVQGGAADYMKIGMVRAQAAIKKAENEGKIPRGAVRLVLTIHDALEFYVRNDVSTQTVIDLINPCISFTVKGLPVEIRADWHEGYQWGAVAEIHLDDDKKISGYSLEYELPWEKQAFEWKGDTLHETLDQYYAWEWQRFGHAAEFYARRNPEFVLAEREQPEPVKTPDPPQAPSQPGPPPDTDDEPNPPSPWDEAVAAAAVEQATRESALAVVSYEAGKEAGRRERRGLDDLLDEPTEAEEEPPWLHSPTYVPSKDDHKPMAFSDPPQRMVATITLSEMPDDQQWPRFKKWLNTGRSGTTKVVVETPEGSLTFDDTYRIDADDQAEISLLLGGAALAIAPEEVDADLVMAGVV